MGILVHDEAESNAPIVFTISVVESWFFLEDCTAAAWEEAYHATPARLSRTNQNGFVSQKCNQHSSGSGSRAQQ
jgi:hypothetical protein